MFLLLILQLPIFLRHSFKVYAIDRGVKLSNLDYISIGNRIRKRRELLGYSRERLAEMLDITPKFCSDIEIGAKGMSLATLNKLSNTLMLSADYILYGESDESSSGEIVRLLKKCPEDKLIYAEEILRTYIKSCIGE